MDRHSTVQLLEAMRGFFKFLQDCRAADQIPTFDEVRAILRCGHQILSFYHLWRLFRGSLHSNPLARDAAMRGVAQGLVLADPTEDAIFRTIHAQLAADWGNVVGGWKRPPAGPPQVHLMTLFGDDNVAHALRDLTRWFVDDQHARVQQEKVGAWLEEWEAAEGVTWTR